MSLGICKWCFCPVWKDDKRKQIEGQWYHEHCGIRVNAWQVEHKRSWLEQIKEREGKE